MSRRTYANPVHAGYFADPYVWRAGDRYCAIGTGPAEAAGAVGPAVFPLLESPDLVSWQPAGQALRRPDAALGDAYWAPEVVAADGRWFLYYSVGHGDRRHQLRVAVADAPLGPYEDVAALTDPDDVPFAIDPHAWRDADGRWYLFHARDFLETAEAGGRAPRVGTALVVHELVGMTSMAPAGEVVARAHHDWQRFAAGREIYGRVCDWHTLEGPCVVRDGSRLYCLYSGGCWQNDSYGVDYVVADSVRGPWSDAGAEAGPRVLRTAPGRVIGPGHCSVVTGPDDLTRYIVYHAWGPDMSARRMYIDELAMTPDGPRSPGPTWTPREIAVPEAAPA